MQTSQISVIIPTMKGREAMLEKLISTIPKDCEIIVVDDEDKLLAAKRNKGAMQATGEYLFFVDDDNYLKEGAVQEMMVVFLADKMGSIGVMAMVACYDDKKMIIADGGSSRSMITGFTSGINTNRALFAAENKDWLYSVDEVANAFMMPRHVFDEVGGFDEQTFPIDLDEADICKRIKNMGYIATYNLKAVCYHKSQTYSHIPDFRRPLNAYFLGRNLVLYQRKHLDALSFLLFASIFLPVRTCFYTASLVWRKKFQMIPHFLKGQWDGLRDRRENPYQQKS